MAWRNALKYCRESLSEDDYELIKAYEAPEQLSQALQQVHDRYSTRAVPRVLRQLQPQLATFRTFFMILLVGMASRSISAACLWVTLGLLFELACQSEQTLTETTRMLSDIGQNIQLLNIYSETITLDPALAQMLFDTLVDLVICSVPVIKHFRKHRLQTPALALLWPAVRSKFSHSLENILRKVTHLKELVEAHNAKQSHQTNAELLQKLSELQTHQVHCLDEGLLSLPCYSLPFQPNPEFYGRRNILDQISEALQNSDHCQEIPSVAIWGTGGIGKSQIALEYANMQITAGVPIVIWITCGKEAEITKSFDQAAHKLNIPGLSLYNTPDQNRSLVLQYLQGIHTPWLLIFDHLEDSDFIREIWPKTGNGTIIVTCRSEFVAEDYAAKAIEIPIFSDEEGSELIFKIIGENTPSYHLVTLAKRLSHKLGGLALAIDLMSKQMKICNKNLEEFLIFYEEHRRVLGKRDHRIQNPWYENDLETVWQACFENRSPEAKHMMRLLCFVAPDAIAPTLFVGQQDLPSGFKFLKNIKTFDEVMAELLDDSLISINDETSLLSIHRLIQAAYWDRLNGEDRQATFRASLQIFQNTFPSKNASGHMYDHHQTCQKLIQHVQSFIDRYNELRKDGFIERINNMTELLCRAARYCQEAALLEDSRKILDTAFANCTDTDSLEYASICDGAGALDTEFAYYKRANVMFKNQLRIVKLSPESTDSDISYAYSALAYVLPGLWKYDEAIEAANKAIDFFKYEPVEEAVRFHPDRLYRNLARAWFCAGELNKAQQYFEEADKWTTDIFGPNSHYHGETCYSFGRIAAERGDFDEAKRLYEEAYRCMYEGRPTAQAIAATLLQQGRVAMAQDRDEDALKFFEHALTICQLNESKGNKGETARVRWRMSQVLEKLGMLEEAQVMMAAAETAKNELYSTGLFVRPEDGKEENVWDGLVGIMYR